MKDSKQTTLTVNGTDYTVNYDHLDYTILDDFKYDPDLKVELQQLLYDKLNNITRDKIIEVHRIPSEFLEDGSYDYE